MVSGVRFGRDSSPTWRDQAYKVASSVFDAPMKLEQKADAFAKEASKASTYSPSWLFDAARDKALRVTNLWLKHDYNDFTKLGIGKKSIELANVPRGAVMVLLYLVTVGSREWAAYPRCKKNNDYREMWDIFRRDPFAITALLFLLPPVQQVMMSVLQKASTFKFFDSTGKVLSYSDFPNLNVVNKDILKSMVLEGNAPGMLKALEAFNGQDLAKKASNERFKTLAAEAKTAVSSLATLHKNAQQTLKEQVEAKTLKRDSDAYRKAFRELIQKATDFDALATQAFQAFDEHDTLHKNWLKETLKTKPAEELKELLSKMPNGLKRVFENHARRLCIPVDTITLLTVGVGIGLFPVLYNMWRNESNFKEELKKQQAAQAMPSLAAPPPSPFQMMRPMGVGTMPFVPPAV